MEECLCCKREIKRIEDYPKVFIESVERIAIPEIIGDSDYDIVPARICERDWFFRKREVDNPEFFRILRMLINKTTPVVVDGLVYEYLNENVTEGADSEVGGEERYVISNDISERVKNVILSNEVQDCLLGLENLVEKEVETKKLLSMGFVSPFGDYENVHLFFSSYNNLSQVGVYISDGDSWSLRLMELKYQGRLFVPVSQ